MLFVKELLMDNVCHDLSGKGNFKYLIKTNTEKSIENVLNLFLVLELPEKRRGGKGNVVFVFGKLFHGVGKADYRVIRTGSDTFAAIDTSFFHDDCFPVVDTDSFHGAPSDTVCAPFAFLNIERYGTEMLRHAHPLVDRFFFGEIDFRVERGPYTDFGINGKFVGALFDVKKPHACSKAHFPYFIGSS